MNKKSILTVLVFCVVACNAPDKDPGAGNSEAQNPSPGAPAGNSETQNAPTDAPAGNSVAQNPPLDVLQYYLNLKKLSKDQMYPGANGALVNKERKQVMDAAGVPISLVHSIKLMTSGTNQARWAFLVQESFTEPDTEFPEHDRYTCSLLVFISREGRWEQENNDMFNESDENGVTRREKPCGFELAWENEFPVLLSADGKVRRENGKYVLETLESGDPR